MYLQLNLAKELIETNPVESLRICNDILNNDPNNSAALFMAARIFLDTNKHGLAYNLFKQYTQLVPENDEGWSHLGMCLEFIDQEEAIKCFQKAIEISPNNPGPLVNLGLMYSYTARPDEAIDLYYQALEKDHNFAPALDNLAYAQLMNRDWEQGWNQYRYSLGRKHRSSRDYHVPEWDGKSPGNVVVYRDQGLGDEIMFSSCIPDAKEKANIIIDCSPRLRGLFLRSFDVPTYGTGFDENTPLMDDHKIDYQCSFGDLPRFFRNSDDSFPGTPYLKVDPEKKRKYKRRLNSFNGPKIGLAWNGGLMDTHRAVRCVSLEELKPILELDANFFSLEYDNPGDLSHYGIHHWADAVDRKADHDETAAFISELDFIISVTTTVIHTAGAVGAKCYCLTPKWPSWRFHLDGDFPWNDSVELVRQAPDESWGDTIKNLAKRIEDEYGICRNRPKTTSSISRASEFNYATDAKAYRVCSSLN